MTYVAYIIVVNVQNSMMNAAYVIERNMNKNKEKMKNEQERHLKRYKKITFYVFVSKYSKIF